MTPPFAVGPHVAVLTPNQTEQFTADGTGLTWSVNGVVGGSATVGTIASTGLYTPPTSAGTFTVTATTPGQTASDSATVYVTTDAGVTTYHNDNMRTGDNLNETVLTTTNVNSTTFGKLFTYPLDGLALASPVYMADVNIPGQGIHNVVYVATEHDSVYAFDANGLDSAPLWHDSFIDPAAGVTTVPIADVGEDDDPDEIGINATPVIDPSTGTLYVVAATKEIVNGQATYVFRLHALDITTGAEKFGGPVVIQASVPGTGIDSSGGMITFNPLRENERTGLLLSNGVVYFAFSSHSDVDPYHGWVFGYNASNLQQVLVYCDTPNSTEGGIWMDEDGLATDSSGDIYFTTGNGGFDANTGGSDYGDSYEKISPTGTVVDYFTPDNQATLNADDLDTSSGGVLLLPTQSGPYPDELVSAGKDGTVYVVNRDNMGHYSATTNHVIQSLTGIFPNNSGGDGGNFSSPVYFNGYVYFAPVLGTVQAFQLTNGLLSTAPTSQSSEVYGGRGGTMAISANGSSNGILWVLQNPSMGSGGGTTAPGVLHAYDATNLGNELYNSSQAGSRDTLDAWLKFSVPVVVNGQVFVTSSSQLTVYGLLPNPPAGSSDPPADPPAGSSAAVLSTAVPADANTPIQAGHLVQNTPLPTVVAAQVTASPGDPTATSSGPAQGVGLGVVPSQPTAVPRGPLFVAKAKPVSTHQAFDQTWITYRRTRVNDVGPVSAPAGVI